jgi:Fibronectin type III domain
MDIKKIMLSVATIIGIGGGTYFFTKESDALLAPNKVECTEQHDKSLKINWSSVKEASGYELRYRDTAALATTTKTIRVGKDTLYVLNGLERNHGYEITVFSLSQEGTTERISESGTIKTAKTLDWVVADDVIHFNAPTDTICAYTDCTAITVDSNGRFPLAFLVESHVYKIEMSPKSSATVPVVRAWIKVQKIGQQLHIINIGGHACGAAQALINPPSADSCVGLKVFPPALCGTFPIAGGSVRYWFDFDSNNCQIGLLSPANLNDYNIIVSDCKIKSDLK